VVAAVAAVDKASMSLYTHFDWESRGTIQIVQKRSQRLQRPKSAIMMFLSDTSTHKNIKKYFIFIVYNLK